MLISPFTQSHDRQILSSIHPHHADFCLRNPRCTCEVMFSAEKKRNFEASSFGNYIWANLWCRMGGGVKSRVLMLFGSAKSATRSKIVGLWVVPGFGYLKQFKRVELNKWGFVLTFMRYLKDLISGYRFPLSEADPYHGNLCSITFESLKTP